MQDCYISATYNPRHFVSFLFFNSSVSFVSDLLTVQGSNPRLGEDERTNHYHYSQLSCTLGLRIHIFFPRAWIKKRTNVLLVERVLKWY